MTTWNLNGNQKHVLLCNGSSCLRKGGEEITGVIRNEITARGMDSVIHTTRTRCNGRCKDAPVVIVYPEGTWYGNLDEDSARLLVESNLEKGEKVEELITYTTTEQGLVLQNDRPLGIMKQKSTEKVGG